MAMQISIKLIMIAAVLLIPLVVAIYLIVMRSRSGTSFRTNRNAEPCLDCGESVSINFNYCPRCGSRLE